MADDTRTYGATFLNSGGGGDQMVERKGGGKRGKRDKEEKKEGKKRKKDPYAAKQHAKQYICNHEGWRINVNVRETLITHTRCAIPRGCPRKSSLFFRQGNNE